MHHGIPFFRALLSVLIGVLFIAGLIPASPVSAADWPDLEKIGGNIPDYVLPLTAGPNINGGGDSIYLHWNCTYHDGTDNWRDVYLVISYYPDPSQLAGGSVEAFIDRYKKYGDRGPHIENNPAWREEKAATGNYHEIEWQNTAERFSILYKWDSMTIPWNGLRLIAYKEHFRIEIIGEGTA